MKKIYTAPEISITTFTTEDIITASGTTAGLNMHDDILDATSMKGDDLSSGSWD